MADDDKAAQASGTPEIERLKLKIGLVKFFIGTVVLGLVSLFLNHQYQRSQIEQEREKSRHAMLLQDKIGTLIWIDQEVDLTRYRGEQRFKDLRAEYARF